MDSTSAFNQFIVEQQTILKQYQSALLNAQQDQAALRRLLLDSQQGECVFDGGNIVADQCFSYVVNLQTGPGIPPLYPGALSVFVIALKNAKKVRVQASMVINDNLAQNIFIGCLSRDSQNPQPSSSFYFLGSSNPSGLYDGNSSSIQAVYVINNELPCSGAQFLHIGLVADGGTDFYSPSQPCSYQLIR